MPVNVMGLIRIGSLSGVSLESQQKSAITADAIRSALSFVNSGQAQLTSSTNNLLKIQNKATATIEQNKTTINTMQSIDVAGLKKQLAELKMQQSADYSVINQLNANAVNSLPALI
jgi:hypothetical protein